MPESLPERMKSYNAVLGGIAIALLIFTVLKLHHWLNSESGDLYYWVVPWLQHIQEHGHWRSLEASFANYNPPYIYALSLSSLVFPHLSPLLTIKIVDLPFLILAAAAAYRICRSVGASRLRSLLGAALLSLSPEVSLNSWYWGQCDIIYTAFILWTAALLLEKRSYSAMAMFGLALAFKLQAMLIGPLLLALILAGDLPLAAVVVTPAVYLLMLLPAHLAGRSWKSLFLIYSDQANYYSALSMHAPNPYVVIQKLTQDPHAVARISTLGTAFAGIVALALAFYFRAHVSLRRRTGLIASFALLLLIMPYLLPKMHERYFFPADCLLVLSAVLRPAFLPAAVLMQISVVMIYRSILHDQLPSDRQMLLPLFFSTAAVFATCTALRFLLADPANKREIVTDSRAIVSANDTTDIAR